MSATSQVSQANPPPAFVCTLSKTLMENPVIALCGHLFENTVAATQPLCPVDNTSLMKLIPLTDLKQEIEKWKALQIAVTQKKLSASIVKQTDPQELKDLSTRFSQMPLPTPTPFTVCQGAHWDDIHGFTLISGGSFVSCSKDNTIKMWDVNGKFRRKLYPDPANRGYKYWGTALTTFTNNRWASGTRDGKITIWDQRGNVVKTLTYNPSSEQQAEYVCKDRNKARINCITEYETFQSNLTFLTGTPRDVQLWDLNSSRLLKTYEASANDWVYCIEVLENWNLLVVIGSDLEYWKMDGDAPVKHSLIQETAWQRRGKQRPHISAITRLDHDRGHLASALFDGSVKINDIDANQLLRNYKEHVGRVWSVVNLKPHLLASSADDGSIKIWDVRQLSSCLTIGGNPGRVSSLLRLSEHVLISGSCPDKVFESVEKASISFWDIRKIA